MSPNIQRNRIRSIDMMRGLVMLIMLIDHVRERFFLHLQVSDPMDIDTTSPALFFTRLAAHYCAPTFVFLTGLSAWLYANPADSVNKPKPTRNVREFLFKVDCLFCSWSSHLLRLVGGRVSKRFIFR